jgi:phage shock protein A
MASLFRSLRNFFREKKDQAAEAIGDPARDAKYDIEDAETQIGKFESEIQRLIKANITRKQELADAQAEVSKWSAIAARAAEAANRADVESAVTKKQGAETQVTAFTDEIKRNEGTVEELRRQLSLARNKIAKAKSNQAVLSARLEGAKVRTRLQQASSGIGGGPLSRLDNLEKAVRDAESGAEAWEELRRDASSDLEEKYGSGDASVDEEVAALMGKAKVEPDPS